MTEPIHIIPTGAKTGGVVGGVVGSSIGGPVGGAAGAKIGTWVGAGLATLLLVSTLAGEAQDQRYYNKPGS